MYITVPYTPMSWVQRLTYFISISKNCIYLGCATWWFDIHTSCKMITTVKLINILSPHIFAGVIRASEVYSLSKFPVLLIIVIIAVH